MEPAEGPSLAQQHGSNEEIQAPPVAKVASSYQGSSQEDPFATPRRGSSALVGSSAPSIITTRSSRRVDVIEQSPIHSQTASRHSAPSIIADDDVAAEPAQAVPAAPETTTGNRRSCWGKACDAFHRQISFKETWEIINQTEVFWPFTWKKYFVLFIILCLIAGIVVSNHYTHWIHKAESITRTYMIPVLAVVIGLEPAMFFVVLLTARVPPRDGEDTRGRRKEKTPAVLEAGVIQPPPQEFNTAFVIPCHNSDRGALLTVLQSCYPYFRPHDVFIVDNGRSRYPKDLYFRDWVRDQHPEINYIWSPIGSKNAAQMVGAMAARDYEYILTTDDDVSLPPNYRHPTHLINEKVRAVAFPLEGIDAKGNCPLFLVAWQDCEYRMAGLTKLAESRLCGVCFPHGAGWFVNRETLVEILSKYHPTDFIAEDVNAGIALMKINKRIAFDGRVVLATEVPRTLLGPGLNWFKQRVKSWEMGRHGLLVKFIQRFFALNGQRTPQGIFAQKFIMLYSTASIAIDYVRIPIFVTMGNDTGFWRNVILLSLVAILPLLLYNYIKCWSRPDMRVRLGAALTYPVYKQLYSLVCILGAIRCVIFYVGGYQKAKPVSKMVKDEDDACFWLDPRFDDNPGWLVDELEENLRREEEERTESRRESTVPAQSQLSSSNGTRSRTRSSVVSGDQQNPFGESSGQRSSVSAHEEPEAVSTSRDLAES